MEHTPSAIRSKAPTLYLFYLFKDGNTSNGRRRRHIPLWLSFISSFYYNIFSCTDHNSSFLFRPFFLPHGRPTYPFPRDLFRYLTPINFLHSLLGTPVETLLSLPCHSRFRNSVYALLSVVRSRPRPVPHSLLSPVRSNTLVGRPSHSLHPR